MEAQTSTTAETAPASEQKPAQTAPSAPKQDAFALLSARVDVIESKLRRHGISLSEEAEASDGSK